MSREGEPVDSTQPRTRDSERGRGEVLLVSAFLIMGAFVGSWFIAEDWSERRTRDGLLAVVSRSSEVVVGGKRLADPSPVLGALRGLTHVPAHHSGPLAPLRLELLAGGDTIPVVLARDSERPEEFWVYRPGSNWHNNPLGEEAGRVRSAELDAFFRQYGR